MDVTNQDCELACRELLERFFADHPDATAQKRVLRALRFLTADNKLLGGRPEGWAAGIIYAVANRDRQACGFFPHRSSGWAGSAIRRYVSPERDYSGTVGHGIIRILLGTWQFAQTQWK